MLLVYGIYNFRPKRTAFRNDYCLFCARPRRSEEIRSFDVCHLFWIPFASAGLPAALALYILSPLAARSARNECWIQVGRLCGSSDFGCNFLDNSHHAGYPHLWMVDAHCHAPRCDTHPRSSSAEAQGLIAQTEAGWRCSCLRHGLSFLWHRSFMLSSQGSCPRCGVVRA